MITIISIAKMLSPREEKNVTISTMIAAMQQITIYKATNYTN